MSNGTLYGEPSPYERGGFRYAKTDAARCRHRDAHGQNRCILSHHRDGVHVFGSPIWEAEVRNSKAVSDVIDERLRQIGQEGWMAEHDDEHGDGSMAIAAACYALPSGMRQMTEMSCPWGWPWSPEWWKPKGGRKDLVRAAALILAEIERLDRHERRAKRYARARGHNMTQRRRR